MGKRAWFGQDREFWPILLLFLAALGPALCLLWFMNAAMQNERLAARERLAQAYRSHLDLARDRLENALRQWSDSLESIATNAAPTAFSRMVELGLVESAVLLGSNGVVTYPNRATQLRLPLSEDYFEEASRLEHGRKDFIPAAEAYRALASSTNIHLGARALQGQVRCLLRAGKTNAALQVISGTLQDERFRYAADAQGRSIVANAEFLALELLNDPALPAYRTTQARLQQRLLDYSDPVLAAPQRLFLMGALKKLSAGALPAAWHAEELAARFLETQRDLQAPSGLSQTGITDIWRFSTASERFVALFTTRRLAANLQRSLNDTAEAEISLLPPGATPENALAAIDAGKVLPGWQLALALKDPALLPLAPRGALYLWTGLLALVAMVVLVLAAVSVSRRRLAIARLKNDLAATVSHELKTPLSSMRVLVETLLESPTLDPRTTREYLELIAQENERLSRLIENFLCFSRLERNKWSFQFAPVRVADVVAAVTAAMRGRCAANERRIEVQVAPDLPLVRADVEALSTALINLVDNACKYSGESKQVLLRANTENGDVVFSVIDEGIGIAPGEARKIFRPFYQSDRRLSRVGSGVGLGLTIVQQIIAAHKGRASVISKPGGGSSFMVTVPAISNTQTHACNGAHC